MHDADFIFNKMIKAGLSPDRFTYTSLISGYVAGNNLKEAFRLHDEMLQRGFVPDDKF